MKRYGLAPETLRCVPKISIETFSTAVIMLYESLSGREWDTSSLWLGGFCDMDFIQSMSRKCQQVISTYREESLFHNPYGQEQREQDAIRNGDLDALEASFREVYPGKVGTLSVSPLRHTKNLAVVLITLASRSAIAGGLLPEIAYSMADAFIQRTEELTAEGEVVALARQAEIEFCQQVRALAGHSSNPLIARCKALVFRKMPTIFPSCSTGRRGSPSRTTLPGKRWSIPSIIWFTPTLPWMRWQPCWALPLKAISSAYSSAGRV